MVKVIDKHGVFERINTIVPLSLELGCGSRKRKLGTIGIDILDYPDVDLVGDVFDILRLFPDNSVDNVFAHHFIEHVSDINLLMSELSRIVKVNGELEFVAPHFSNPYFYSDPTHRSFFGLYTFCYLTNSSLFSRQVHTYQNRLYFNLENVDLRFKSAKPFYFRYLIKNIIGSVFNSCNYMKELYEENFCYFFPCYEICYKFKRIDLQVA